MTARVAERILICRPDHLGDVLLTLPAVAALRAAFPGAYMGLVLDRSTADVASRCPDVDERFALPFPPLTHTEAGTDWVREVTDTAKDLRDRYDLVILSRPEDPWSAQLAAAAGIPLRVGYAMPGSECFLTHAIPLREDLHAAMQTLRLAQEAARCLGVSPAGEAAMTESLRSLAQVRSYRRLTKRPWRSTCCRKPPLRARDPSSCNRARAGRSRTGPRSDGESSGPRSDDGGA